MTTGGRCRHQPRSRRGGLLRHSGQALQQSHRTRGCARPRRSHGNKAGTKGSWSRLDRLCPAGTPKHHHPRADRRPIPAAESSRQSASFRTPPAAAPKDPPFPQPKAGIRTSIVKSVVGRSAGRELNARVSRAGRRMRQPGRLDENQQSRNVFSYCSGQLPWSSASGSPFALPAVRRKASVKPRPLAACGITTAPWSRPTGESPSRHGPAVHDHT